MNTTPQEKILSQFFSAGMPAETASAKAQLFHSALHRLRFRGINKPFHAFYVPGRIEFLGKHTDYAGGRSLICAVDRGFCIVAAARTDRMVRILGETDVSFEFQPELIPKPGHWSNYPMTVARRIAQNFSGKLLGADIAFISDLPQSSGLSSSSVLVIAFFLTLSSINRLSDRPEYQSNIHTQSDLADYLGCIENGQTIGTLTGDRGVGTFGGSEDHTAILTAVPNQLSQYFFCPVRHERQIPLPPDHSLVIAVSGVIAEKTGAAQAAYNNASLATRAILDHWNKSTGQGDATLAAAIARDGALQQLRQSLSDQKLIDRLDQFAVESTQIIPAAGDALIAGRLDDLGKLVDRSQDLATRLLKNQIPETIHLARSARECGATASSSFGAGFGGSVWALVRCSDIEQFISDWKSKYQSTFPDAAARAAFFPATAGVPAMRINLDY